MSENRDQAVVSALQYLTAGIAWWAALFAIVLARFEENASWSTGGAVQIVAGVAACFALLYVLSAWLPRASRTDLLERLDPSMRKVARVIFLGGTLAAVVGVVSCGEVFGRMKREEAVSNLADRFLTSSSRLEYAYIGCVTCTRIEPLGSALLRVAEEVPTAQVRWVAVKGADLRDVLALVKANPQQISCRQVIPDPAQPIDAIRGTALAYEGARKRATLVETEGPERYRRLDPLDDDREIEDRHAFFEKLYNNGTPCEELASP